MDIRNELEKQGFIMDVKDSNKWYYDYSDFETLSMIITQHPKLDNTTCVKISQFEISDMLNNVNHVKFNYDLYFSNLRLFYEFLALINYPVLNKVK